MADQPKKPTLADLLKADPDDLFTPEIERELEELERKLLGRPMSAASSIQAPITNPLPASDPSQWAPQSQSGQVIFNGTAPEAATPTPQPAPEPMDPQSHQADTQSHQPEPTQPQQAKPRGIFGDIPADMKQDERELVQQIRSQFDVAHEAGDAAGYAPMPGQGEPASDTSTASIEESTAGRLDASNLSEFIEALKENTQELRILNAFNENRLAMGGREEVYDA